MTEYLINSSYALCWKMHYDIMSSIIFEFPHKKNIPMYHPAKWDSRSNPNNSEKEALKTPETP